MGSYESMHAKLEPLHLYTLAQGGEVGCELNAYACGLDPLLKWSAKALLLPPKATG